MTLRVIRSKIWALLAAVFDPYSWKFFTYTCACARCGFTIYQGVDSRPPARWSIGRRQGQLAIICPTCANDLDVLGFYPGRVI